MIKITLEVNTVEEAIVTLGKLANSGKVRAEAAKTVTAPAGGAEDTSKKERKGRADKGKPRGSHKNAGPTTPATGGGDNEEAAGASKAADQAANSTPTPSSPVSDPAPTTEATEVQAQEAIQKVFVLQGGPQLAMDTLAKFGVKRGRDLKPEQRGEFVAACEEILKANS